MKNETNNVVTATNTTTFISRKIGNTVYRVAVSFSNTSKEHIEDKIIRLAENELNFNSFSAIINLPQTELLLEGGSL